MSGLVQVAGAVGACVPCVQGPLLSPACSGFYTVNPGCFLATSHDLLAALRHWNLLDWSLVNTMHGDNALRVTPDASAPGSDVATGTSGRSAPSVGNEM